MSSPSLLVFWGDLSLFGVGRIMNVRGKQMIEKNKTGKLFLLSSTSGGGKTTLANKLIEDLGSVHDLSRVITYTSRAPRGTEQHGVDYYFVAEREFKVKIEEQFFLEWSTAYGHYKGMPGDILEHVARGKSYIAVLDRAGVRSVKQACRQAVAIWLDVPSLFELEKRLKSRGTEDSGELAKRLLLAQQELEEERANSLYQYRVMNDVFDRSLRELKHLIEQELKKVPSNR